MTFDCVSVSVCVSFTWRPSSRETLSSVRSGRLSISVAILKASWASLKMWEDEWIFFWIDSNTVWSLQASPDNMANKQEHRGCVKHLVFHFNNCLPFLSFYKWDQVQSEGMESICENQLCSLAKVFLLDLSLYFDWSIQSKPGFRNLHTPKRNFCLWSS